MNNCVIREICDEELQKCVDVIRKSFSTVAKDFDLTKENCPTNPAYIGIESLISLKGKGTNMFGLFVEDMQVGFVAVTKQSDVLYVMEKLAILPEYRHFGYGRALMEHVKMHVKALNGEIVAIGMINENTVLKNWYSAYGFEEKGTKVFSHLPFTVCFMEIKI